MDVTSYLGRIGYNGSLEPSIVTLRALHIAHLQTVPFENLDIHLGRPIVLEEKALFDKIVVRRRGGFCYELNGLFAALLRELGFAVTHFSASGVLGNGSFGREFDHLTLLVETPVDDEEPGDIQTPAAATLRWLADVGWGDTFREPLQIDEQGEQPAGDRVYRIDREGDFRTLWQRYDDGRWEKQYRFTLQPRRFSDFEDMCHYHQSSPQSPFTQKQICTRATPEGRISLDDTRLITTVHGRRTERKSGPDEYRRLLLLYFGIDLRE